MNMHIDKSKTSDTIMDTNFKREDGSTQIGAPPKIVLEVVRITP